MQQGTVNSLVTTSKGISLLVVIVVCLNIISAKLFVRCDATEDDIYTLTDGSRKIASNLSGNVEAKLFFSRSVKELPPIIKTYATRVEEVLREYADLSGDKLVVDVVDPKPDSEEEEQAAAFGIQGVALPNQDRMYFGIVFLRGAKEVQIPYLDPRREELLEYDVSEALVQLFQEKKPTLGLMSSLPMMGNPMLQQQPWVISQYLQRNYELKDIAANVDKIDAGVDVLMVVHPKNLEDKTLYAIDQYLLKGGKLIVAVDPLSRFDMSQSSQAQMMGQRPSLSSDLGRLFAAWSLDYNAQKMVGDANFTSNVGTSQGQRVSYPFFMSMNDQAFSDKAVITGDMRQMLYAEGGAISSKPDSPYSFEPLIESTEESGMIDTQMAARMPPDAIIKEFKPVGKRHTLAALVRGKFKSAYPGGYQAPAAEGEAPQGPPTGPHIEEADAERSVVVIADTDFLFDSNAVDQMRFGGQIVARPRNDNLAFMANSVDFLGGSQDLISIRSRGKISRPFTKVAEIQKEAQERWKDKEEELSSQLADLQKKLASMQAERTDGNLLTLTTEQQDEIKRFREEEARLRKERRRVRKNLREDIERLGQHLIALNMLVLPLGVSLFGYGIFQMRSRRTKKGRNHEK